MALPLPVLPQILDALGLGVRPTRAEALKLRRIISIECRKASSTASRAAAPRV